MDFLMIGATALWYSPCRLYGEARGDELPPEFAPAGRRGWLREAKQRLEAERAKDPQPVPRSRPKRVKEAKRRLEEELWTEVRANDAYEHYRAHGRMKNGRGFGAPPQPYTPPASPAGRVNLTDLDSKVLKGLRGWIQLRHRASRDQRAPHRPGRRSPDRRRRLRNLQRGQITPVHGPAAAVDRPGNRAPKQT